MLAKIYDRFDLTGGASPPEFEFEFWPLPADDPSLQRYSPSVCKVGQTVMLELELKNVGNLMPQDVVVTFFTSMGELRADITSTIVHQHYAVVVAKVGPFTMGMVGRVGGEVYRAALGRIDATPFQFEVLPPYSISQYFPREGLVVGGTVLTAVLVKFPPVDKNPVVADFNGLLANGTLSSKAGDTQTVTFVIPRHSDFRTTKDIFLPHVLVYVVGSGASGPTSVSSSFEFTYLALPSTPPQIRLVSPVRVAINEETQTIIRITIDGIVVPDPTSDIVVTVNGAGVVDFKYSQLDLLSASIQLMPPPVRNQEETTMLVRVAWAAGKYVETSIEVFKRSAEVAFFYPVSGFQRTVITVGMLYLRDRSLTPTCEITTTSGASYAAKILTTSPNVQIEVPSSLDLDKSEFVTISVEYLNGDYVEFEWEFVPDTSSVYSVSVPSDAVHLWRSQHRSCSHQFSFRHEQPALLFTLVHHLHRQSGSRHRRA